MNTQNRISSASITQADIDAIMTRARADRAEVMRTALSQVAVAFKHLAAHLRPSRARLPQSGAWA